MFSDCCGQLSTAKNMPFYVPDETEEGVDVPGAFDFDFRGSVFEWAPLLKTCVHNAFAGLEPSTPLAQLALFDNRDNNHNYQRLQRALKPPKDKTKERRLLLANRNLSSAGEKLPFVHFNIRYFTFDPEITGDQQQTLCPISLKTLPRSS
jgi:hypothetical protein